MQNGTGSGFRNMYINFVSHYFGMSDRILNFIYIYLMIATYGKNEKWIALQLNINSVKCHFFNYADYIVYCSVKS